MTQATITEPVSQPPSHRSGSVAPTGTARRRALLVRLLLVAAAVAAASCFVVARAHVVPGGLGSFPLVGMGHAPGPLPAGITVRRSGYDGQFYLRLAQDPFGNATVSHGQRLDFPAYRQQRVGYPLLAWAAGRLPGISPTRALVLVNVLAVGVIAWCGSGLSRRAGRGALLGALLGVLPFAVVALARDTSEPVFVGALLTAFLALRDRRPVLAAVAVAVAVFTREQGLLALGALIVVAWCSAEGVRPRVRRLAAPGAVAIAWLGWQAFLTARWGRCRCFRAAQRWPAPGRRQPHRREGSEWGPRPPRNPADRCGPGGGFRAPVGGVEERIRAPDVGVLALVRQPDAVAVTWGASLLLTLCLTTAVWVDPNAFVRATAEATTLAVVLLFAPVARRWAAPATVVLLLAVTAYLVAERVNGV